MQLFYDRRDEVLADRLGDQRLFWLDDLGAIPLDEAKPEAAGFLFAGARPIDDYAKLVTAYPNILDRPAARAPLLELDRVLDALDPCNIPMPRTWRLELDVALPPDLEFPLFLRTPRTSWKCGGWSARVTNTRELAAESAALRRATQWNSVILARQWLDLAPAGDGPYGPIPQEVRVWIVDRVPVAWSFHYLGLLPTPTGFPLPASDLTIIKDLALQVGRYFAARLIVADFARLTSGNWAFIEAGPGSCAGTAHESVFKAVVHKLLGHASPPFASTTGGPL